MWRILTVLSIVAVIAAAVLFLSPKQEVEEIQQQTSTPKVEATEIAEVQQPTETVVTIPEGIVPEEYNQQINEKHKEFVDAFELAQDEGKHATMEPALNYAYEIVTNKELGDRVNGYGIQAIREAVHVDPSLRYKAGKMLDHAIEHGGPEVRDEAILAFFNEIDRQKGKRLYFDNLNTGVFGAKVLVQMSFEVGGPIAEEYAASQLTSDDAVVRAAAVACIRQFDPECLKYTETIGQMVDMDQNINVRTLAYRYYDKELERQRNDPVMRMLDD